MRWLMSVTILLAGCPKRSGPAVQLSALIHQADLQWQLRDRVGLDAAGRPLLLARALAPADPEVLWRIVRWRVAEGVAAEDRAAARASFAEARAVAAGCLEHDPAFAARAPGGWAEALGTLPSDRVVCAAWAALAWARWAEVHGAEAAALDLPAIEALIAASGRAAEPGSRAVADWAAGITLATRPAWAGRDLEAAEARLRAAAAADPDAVVVWADLWRLVAVPSGDVEAQRSLARRIAGMEARGPEEHRAAAAVAAGP